MKQNKFVRHWFALLITFSVFYILLSFGDIIEANYVQFSNQVDHRTSAYNTYSFVKVLNSDKILPAKNSELIKCNTFKGHPRPKSFDFFLKSGSFISFAAKIFSVIFLTGHTEIFFCNKFIIRYIHNKDGHKINSFVLLKLFFPQNNNTEVFKNDNNNCAYYMHFNGTWNDRLRYLVYTGF